MKIFLGKNTFEVDLSIEFCLLKLEMIKKFRPIVFINGAENKDYESLLLCFYLR